MNNQGGGGGGCRWPPLLFQLKAPHVSPASALKPDRRAPMIWVPAPPFLPWNPNPPPIYPRRRPRRPKSRASRKLPKTGMVAGVVVTHYHATKPLFPMYDLDLRWGGFGDDLRAGQQGQGQSYLNITFHEHVSPM